MTWLEKYYGPSKESVIIIERKTLTTYLQQCLDNEDYEYASEIKNILDSTPSEYIQVTYPNGYPTYNLTSSIASICYNLSKFVNKKFNDIKAEVYTSTITCPVCGTLNYRNSVSCVECNYVFV